LFSRKIVKTQVEKGAGPDDQEGRRRGRGARPRKKRTAVIVAKGKKAGSPSLAGEGAHRQCACRQGKREGKGECFIVPHRQKAA